MSYLKSSTPFLLVLLLVLAPVTSALAEETNPVGAEFQVNSYTTGYQAEPAVLAHPDGDRFLVVWLDSEQRAIDGNWVDTAGNLIGAEFRVSTDTYFSKESPTLGFGDDGRFVVAWVSEGQDGDATGIFGQRFDSSGTAVGVEYALTSVTSGYQQNPAIMVRDNNGFVVYFTNGDPGSGDGAGTAISGQEVDIDGTVLGNPFLVNTETAGLQWVPSVARDATGDFVVVWQSYYQDGDSSSVHGQRFSSSGVAQGLEFQVNTYTTARQRTAVVAKRSNGDFVVVWNSGNYSSAGSDGNGQGVAGQGFASDGTLIGGEFVVNTTTTDQQYYASIAPYGASRFLVTWSSGGPFAQDGDRFGVFGQVIEIDGNKIGDEFQVNTYTTGDQWFPHMAGAEDSTFMVAWHSDGSAESDNDSYSVQAQVLQTVLFADGFESGDTSAWSSTFP